MALTVREVEHIAELARLSLTDAEKALFRDQLSAILEYAAVLQQVDTSAIPPTAEVLPAAGPLPAGRGSLPARSVMRGDVAEPSMVREDVLANAPESTDGCFRVKAILEAGKEAAGPLPSGWHS